MLKRAIVGALVTTGALWVLAPACSSSPDLAGAGGDCLQVTDCQDGLICCRKQNNTGKCSSDLSCIVSIEEAGGAVQMASDAAPADGGTRDSSAPPSDASTKDTSQPPSETGPPPPDSGRPPADTGAAPPPDSGSAATG